jgi:hypothetical protein
MRRILFLVAVGLLGVLNWGCGQYGSAPAGTTRPGSTPEPQARNELKQLNGWENKAAPPGVNAVVVAPAPAAAPAGGGGEAAQPPAQALSRKIIYNADLTVVVQDLSHADEQLRQVVKDLNGYIAQSEIIGSAGSPRQGHWRIRVPADQVQACVEALVKLGIPEKNSLDSKDVTEEFYDLEARIKNMKVEEGRLQSYLEDKKATSKLEDILAIERELSRVRGEIERAEGRLRMLGNLSTLATLDVTLREVKDYVPPQAPTFAAEIGGTFTGSLDVLRQFGQFLLLALVALTPWLPVIALIVVPTWLLARRALRQSQPATVVPVEPTPQPPAG